MKTNQPNLRQSFKGMVTIELKNHVSIQQNIKLIFVVAQILQLFSFILSKAGMGGMRPETDDPDNYTTEQQRLFIMFSDYTLRQSGLSQSLYCESFNATKSLPQ